MSNYVVGLLGAMQVWSGELCNGLATVTSASFKVEHVSGSFSAWIQATSVLGTPNLRFYYEMSYDDTAAHFATPVGAADIITTMNVETIRIYSFIPPYLPYIRFVVRGNAGNEVDSLVTMYLCVQ
jgi:hypothetical protein